MAILTWKQLRKCSTTTRTDTHQYLAKIYLEDGNKDWTDYFDREHIKHVAARLRADGESFILLRCDEFDDVHEM